MLSQMVNLATFNGKSSYVPIMPLLTVSLQWKQVYSLFLHLKYSLDGNSFSSPKDRTLVYRKPLFYVDNFLACSSIDMSIRVIKKLRRPMSYGNDIADIPNVYPGSAYYCFNCTCLYYIYIFIYTYIIYSVVYQRLFQRNYHNICIRRHWRFKYTIAHWL